MQKATFASRAWSFYENLSSPKNLPDGVEVLNPYRDPAVKAYFESFLDSYFNDDTKRVMVLGINPGRFGAGITGISFTDPVALQNYCGIENDFPKKQEISSDFVYRFIEHWGGVKKFYKSFFLTSVSPLGFVRNGINYNYYDDKDLASIIKPFILDTLRKQKRFGTKDVCILLGTGKNQKAFSEINGELKLFKDVYVLEHPRYIMQYKRKHIGEYLKKYELAFLQALQH